MPDSCGRSCIPRTYPHTNLQGFP
ncbi:hypothetical protein NC653_036629 [Populus alba x Populus x berolinensis]|uniref:Uncharacterized protein n=1 Tax=Populus alba x Populus x berolinensis TaxID=444605 RepID=A0AAD6PW06_9ROSI|nr:hypothetical protein NC653_036629 [Populus alba x Populus x berolinensis]